MSVPQEVWKEVKSGAVNGCHNRLQYVETFKVDQCVDRREHFLGKIENLSEYQEIVHKSEKCQEKILSAKDVYC